MAPRRPLIAALLCALALWPAAAAAKPKSPKAGPVYGHAGRFITDADGRVVTLHGVNMVAKLASQGYAPDAAGFGADDARFLAANGFSVVRLGLIWKAIEPQPGVYDDAYLGRIMRTYRQLHKLGIAVLLDFHQDMFNERFQGEGAPDWAILEQAASEPAVPRTGFPANYATQNAVNHAYDAFWSNAEVPGTDRGVQDYYAGAWAHVAKRFRGKPGIVGYNLFNEPWMGTPLQQCALAGGGTSPNACDVAQFEATTLTDFHRRVTRAIRRVDRSTMVFPAPVLTFDFGGVTGVGRVGKRAGFAFNAYCGQADPLIGVLIPYLAGKPCSFSANLSFTHALDESRRNRDALFMTEFGATDNLATFLDYMNGANALSISWTYWAYCGCGDPTGSVPPEVEGLVIDANQPPSGSNVKADKLLALAQPYATVTSGTPGTRTFDPASRAFGYAYKTKPAGKGPRFAPGSITKVSLPAIQYPAGYRVLVKGARVLSRPRARVLRLAQCGRAERVRLSVSPGGFRAAARKCG